MSIRKLSAPLVAAFVLLLAVAFGCDSADEGVDTRAGVTDTGSGGGPDVAGGGEDLVVGEDTGTVQPPVGNGCPSTSGNHVTGLVRLGDLHATPETTGPSVVVGLPCGREWEDPSKDTCGQGTILVWLCTTPDCSAAGDPVLADRHEDGSLLQSSFDSQPFEFCGVETGTYYILPIIDHDDSSGLSNFDWTMGVKNLAAAGVSWPARVSGAEVQVDGDVALGESLVPTSPDVSPVVIDFFHYAHPGPVWQPEDAWLFVAATLHPDVSQNGVGMRALDLSTQTESDLVEGTDPIDARSLADPDGQRYEGDLEKLAFHNGVAFLATEIQGVVLTVNLGADGGVEQGHTIDLRESGITFGTGDVMHFGVVVEQGEKEFLVISNRESAGKPLPHRPANPLLIVDISDLASGDVTAGIAVDSDAIPDLDDVRLDQLATAGSLLFASESGKNSHARRNDPINRLWVFSLDGATGAVDAHAVYDGMPYNEDGVEVAECGSNPPYRMAGLWAGQVGGQTHAFLGNLRTLSVWAFPTASPDAGQRVRHGSGIDAFDLRLDDYAVGFSVMRPSPDGSKLFLFGDCKSRWLAVRGEDWAGASGSRTQSRRRIAVLDLTSLDGDGLPTFYEGYGDRDTAPDIVREGLNGDDETLNEDIVLGIGTDCRGILWDLYDVFGYLNIAGNTFGSDCQVNRVADAVVTEHHIYIIGEGSPAFGTTGLGVSSEILLLDLDTGREVLDPHWRWFYEGSSLETGYGYFGLTLGERDDLETSKGLFLMPK